MPTSPRTAQFSTQLSNTLPDYRNDKGEGTGMWQIGGIVADRYRVDHTFTGGAMGIVHRVRHLDWDIDLVVKSPRPELFRNTKDRQRFLAEAESWVALGFHPNICCCHYVRVLDDIPRVFAEYIPGGSLSEWIADRRLYAGSEADALRRILDVAIQSARGLEHAHDRGLAHQDVKPANVLLGVDADGAPLAKITDFGLAEAYTAVARGGPGTGSGRGTRWMTRAYASPEQILGHPLDSGTDIYSFAVGMLEMFLSEVSWAVGTAAGEALAEYRGLGGRVPHSGIPPMPSAVADLLAACLQHDRASRPASMAEVTASLAETYRQILDRSYSRPAPRAVDLRADELNNRALSLLDLDRTAAARDAFTAALDADPHHLLATYNYDLLRWRRGAITDEDIVTDLETVRTDTGDPWSVRLLLAHVHMERGDLAAAADLLATAEERDHDDPATVAAVRAAESRALTDAASTGTVPVVIREDEHDPKDPFGDYSLHMPITFSQDSGRILVGSLEGPLHLHDALTGRRLRTLGGHSQRVHSVAFSADGRFAVSADQHGTVRCWDLATGRCLLETDHASIGQMPLLYAYPLVLTANGETGLWPGGDGAVDIVDIRTGTLRRRLSGHRRYLSAIAVSSDDRWALTADHGGSAGHRVRLWDLNTGQVLRTLSEHIDTPLSTVCFGVGDRTALIAGSDVQLWDLETGRNTRTLTGHTYPVDGLAQSADGRYLLSGSRDRTIRFWDLRHGRCVRTLRGHTARVASVSMTPDARFATSVSTDNTLRRWSLPGGPDSGHRCAWQVSRPRPPTDVDGLNHEAERLVTQARNAMSAGRLGAALDLLNQARSLVGHERAPDVLAAWRELGTLVPRTALRGVHPAKTLSEGRLTSAFIARNGAAAVTHSVDGMQIWDVSTLSVRDRFDEPMGAGPVELCATGRRVLLAAPGYAVAVWSLSTMRRADIVTGPDAHIARFASSGGRLVLTGHRGGALGLWDVDTGQRLRSFVGHTDDITTCDVSVDGTRVASASGTSIRLWNLATGRCLKILEGCSAAVLSVGFSPDGRRLLSCGEEDRGIRLWDTATGACLRRFDEHDGHERVVRFTADGRFAVSGNTEGPIRLWDVATGRCVRSTEGRRGPVHDLSLTSDGRYVLSTQALGVQLWELDWELGLKEDLVQP
ncbi:WD40 repeat domain-containing serine/threonine protein kinase [Streptomyces cyaneofuscatus]|uniref:WD40 repeat domain-containing serine/threonine protein kinase n=1 Tax=Streptomyces cyaneofuscatus TaxID=66883 RepID=UPI0038683487|nr:serine/threonine protein kinase [Streptomyces cyaneofuscatus]